jgi:hypothetical protein
VIVDVHLEGLDKALASLRPDVANKAMRRTINELMSQSKTAASKKVRERYNIKAKKLNNYINVRKASGNYLEAKLSVRSRNVSLFNFLYGETSPKLGRRVKGKPVKVKILKTSGVHKLHHAFVMIGKSGNIGIFERVVGVKSSTGKDKIKRLNTVGPAKMFEKVAVPEMQKLVDEKVGTTFERNFNYYIGKVK